MSRRSKSAIILAAMGIVWVAGERQGAAQVKAFPEAEGFGAYATGARTNLASASVYHVTNLNDSGSGSFRDAVSQPNRFVVFDISGVVSITSAVGVQDNVTIAGQTAPGGGITIYGAKVSYTGANNTITRYLRVRKGHTTGRDDAVSLASGTNMIFDHLSVTWGNDETFSMNPSSGETIDKITIQNTIIGQGLDNVNHSAGALMQPNGGYSLLRNLFIDNETRNPKAKGKTQFVNNVVYSWTTAAYILGGDSDGDHWANAQGNYFIQGPQNGSAAFTGGNTDYHLYADNNYYDSNRNGVLDGSVLTQAQYGSVDWVTTPHPYPAVNIEAPQDAYQRIVSQVGPSLYRDEVDTRMIQELSSLGTLGQIVYVEEDLYPSYPGALPSPAKPTDTDNDGIPDAWESSHGLSPTNGSDWKTIGLTGYTRLEEYLNELVSDHADKTWTAASGAWPTGANWSGGVPGWDDDAFVRGSGPGTGGNLTISAAGAQAFRLMIGGNGDAAIGETVSVNSGGVLMVMDTIHVGHQNTATLTINNGGTVEATSVLLGNGSLLGGSNQAGNLVLNSGGTLKTGIIASAGGSGTFLINGGTLMSSASGTFAAPANIGSLGAQLHSNGFASTFCGAISGSGALNKWGTGTVNLTGNNSFAGGIFLKQGALGAGSDANLGGAASAITFQGGLLRVNGTSLTNIDSHAVNWSSFNGGFDIASSAHTFHVNSNISGGGSLAKEGPGVLQLNGANTYTGGTILRAGAVAVSNSGNIGGAGSSISFQGGSLRVLGTALSNLSGHNVNWSSFNGGFDIADPGHTFAINQVIGGIGGLIKDGAGTLVLNAANTFTGNTVINAGVLKMGHPLALQFSTLNFPTGGGTLDLNGYALSIGGIAGGGGFDLKGGTLTVGSNDLSTTFSGVMSDSVGGGKLVKVGSGNLTLTAASSSSFNTIVNEGGVGFTGTVAASGSSPFGTLSAGVILSGGKIARTSSGGAAWDRLFTLGPGGGTLEGSTGYAKFNATGLVPFSAAGNSTLTLSGSQIDNEFKFRLGDPSGGKLALNKIGSGRWIVTTSAAMTYSGDTTISAGTFILNSGDNVMPFGAGKGNLIVSGGQFEMNGRSVKINALSGGGNLNQRNASTETLELGNGNASGTFSGTITDSGTINLVKTGTGVQVLSGTNSYAGTTTVNQGVLQFNSAASIGGTGASVTVNSGAAAAAGFAMNQTFIGRINSASTGAIAVAADSANNLSLSALPVSLGAVGSRSYTGILTPNGASYRLGGGGGTLTLLNTNALTGARSLQMVGAGTVILSGNNDFTGGTTVDSGNLVVATRLPTGPLTINGGLVRINAKAQANDATGTSTVASLTIDSSDAKIDLTNNSMIIDYTGTSPVQTIRQLLLTGTQTGFGIVSTSADASRRLGYADDGNVVRIKFTYSGDANLDGQVDITDLGSLATSWQSGVPWSGGDFNYDGFVDITDLGMLATNWQAGAGSPLSPDSLNDALVTVGISVVPEPNAALLLGLLAAGGLGRRRRSA